MVVVRVSRVGRMSGMMALRGKMVVVGRIRTLMGGGLGLC